MTHEEQRLWLIRKLKAGNPGYSRIPVPKDEQGQKDLLRILMNVRMPAPLGREFLEIQDAYLRRENFIRGINDYVDLFRCSRHKHGRRTHVLRRNQGA